MITAPDRNNPMNIRKTAGARSTPEEALQRFPVLLPFAIYVVFAAAVYWVHGPEPSLSIDHIAYFKLADEIRAEFTLGDYWRTVNSVRVYGVMLAYLFDWTGSHVASLKLLLAGMTVAYLWAFQLFMGLATASRARAVLFSLLSALFVSFGASIWGMTDFAASLNRTLIIPPVMVLVWFFFRRFATPWRYAVFPALILLSLLHLSALHVFLVFGAFEALDYVFRRRLRVDRDVAFFALALVASIGMQAAIESLSGGTTGYIRYTLNMAVPSVAQMMPKVAPPPAIASAPPAGAPGAAAMASPEVVAALAKPKDKLTHEEAWRIELLAFPWRNFPPTPATLLTILSSFGVLLALAVWGAVRTFRSGEVVSLDRGMATFAFAVLISAYGLQILLWSLRDLIPVLPINFEEIRAINMVMIPAIYFIHRLYERPPAPAGLAERGVRVAIVVACALQPIVLVRALPALWREAMIEQAVGRGMLKSSDAPRMLYARQFLGLAGEGRRFYYSSRPALDWLEKNAGPKDRILTNLNEFHGSRVETVGPFLGIVNMDVWDVRRANWAQSLDAIDRALATRDLDKVLALARSLGATYAVVDWPVEGAAYRDRHYSIVRVE